MLLHDLQFGFLSVAHYLLHDVLNRLDEVLESHLVRSQFLTHYFYENQVVVILCDLLACHSWYSGQLTKLRRGQHPFRPDAALRVEQLQHVLNYVHIFHIFAFHVDDFLVRVKVVPHLHFFQFLELLFNKEQGVLDNDALDVLIDKTNFLDLFVSAWLENLMLDVEAGIVVGFEQPRAHLIIEKDVQTDHMEAFTLFLWEGGVIVVFEERKHPSEILLSKLDNLFLDLVHLDSVFGQVLPHNKHRLLPRLIA